MSAGGEHKVIMGVDLEGRDLVVAGPRPLQGHDLRASLKLGAAPPPFRPFHTLHAGAKLKIGAVPTERGRWKRRQRDGVDPIDQE